VTSFIQAAFKPAEQAILETPTRKSKSTKPADAPATRRSGRLAEKVQRKGPMCAEKMAQEVLCKKLEGAIGQPDKEKKGRDRLIQLFDAPLPDDAMEAIEDLLKIINLDGKKVVVPKKGGNKVAITSA
jgi:hypothetical protein